MKRILVIAAVVVTIVVLVYSQQRKSALTQTSSATATVKSDHSKYVLRINEGELLSGVNFQFTPKNGATQLSAGTWTSNGTKVPLHKHVHMEEYFFIHSGSGVLLINDERIPFEAGMSLFVPKDTWHGFEPDKGMVLFVVSSPPGLEEVFRAWDTPGLSKEQIAAIERKHRLIWKPQ